jgi:hypothetical protein
MNLCCRILLLLQALLLGLPTGWCCAIPCQKERGKSPSCCQGEAVQNCPICIRCATAQTQTPQNTHRPAQVCRCQGEDRVPPRSPREIPTGCELDAQAVIPAILVHSPLGTAVPHEEPRLLSRPVHILCCVWLC